MNPNPNLASGYLKTSQVKSWLPSRNTKNTDFKLTVPYDIPEF